LILDCKIYGCIKAVFNDGLCADHYEEQRLASLPSCKAEGCAEKSIYAGLCDHHYRNQPQVDVNICSVDGCGRPVIARELCGPHLQRLYHYGALDGDWRARDKGLRCKHPLYVRWRHFCSDNKICDEWRENFWSFVNTVGDQPSPSHNLRRKDFSRPFGPDNWLWRSKISCKDRAEYQGKWIKLNPEKVKNYSLKKTYGITKDMYDAMFDEQRGLCAICHEPETVRRKNSLAARDLAVDHSHVTGKVRGLLCGRCNLMIAAADTHPNILNDAQSYLDQHKSIE
jgi:Recombination endonuclease VII